MRLIGSLVVLAFAAAPALAQSQECSVEFVRVPDEVRHEIERWLAKETRCTTSLALRVIPTDEGTLYLVAQRPDGRIHEREVPDAAAAGVLVASWVADDWTTPPVAVVEPVAPVAPVAPVIAAPSTMPVVAGPRETSAGVVVATPSRRAGRWLSVTPMLHPGGGGGIRADVDLLGGSKWTLGVGAAYINISDSNDQMAVEMEATRVMAYAARAFELSSGFQLRSSLGLTRTWATGSSVYLDGTWGTFNGEATAVQAELTLLLAHDLSERWSVLGGPVGTMGLFKDGEDDSFFEQFDLMFMGGARFRL